MEVIKIKYVQAGKYASDDLGDIIPDVHPTILVRLDNNKELLFPFTSESFYGIKEKGYCYTKKCWVNTRIRTVTELYQAQDYYRNEGRYAYADKLDIGAKCYHYDESHKSYLSETLPILSKEENFFVRPIDIKESDKYYTPKEQIEENKKDYIARLKMCESAIVFNKVEYYESKATPLDRFKIEIKKFSISERIEIGHELKNKICELSNEKALDKFEYIRRIEPKLLKNLDTQNEKDEYLLYKTKLFETKENPLSDKIQHLLELKKESVLKGDIEKFESIKNEIEKIEVEENKEKITDKTEKNIFYEKNSETNIEFSEKNEKN